jgi:hypothetical protein
MIIELVSDSLRFIHLQSHLTLRTKDAHHMIVVEIFHAAQLKLQAHVKSQTPGTRVNAGKACPTCGGKLAQLIMTVLGVA